MSSRWKRFCCWIGWHSHPRFETVGFDGCSAHARCRWCHGVGLIDSQGNLFSVKQALSPKESTDA